MMSSDQTTPENVAISQIASLTLMNAFIFQDVLSSSNGDVQPVLLTMERNDIAAALADHWGYILEHINYFPIFHVARQILIGLPSNQDVERRLRVLADMARKVVRPRAAFRHDLMGRVYHTLLADRKFLATYYTSVPAATMLLKIALHPGRWPSIQWDDVNSVQEIRIADLACGTGTLLMASAEAIADNHAQACAQSGRPSDFAALHRALVEDVIHGYEVLPSAAHLTASTLALRAPSVNFKRMHLYSLPHGGPGARLGSIEFVESPRISTEDIFGAGGAIAQVSPNERRRKEGAFLPDLDLCVMNPPFTRSSQASLLFGSLPESERQAMQRRLASLIREQSLQANSTAGLGSVFVAVADRYIKPGGKLALVLPKALLSGISWERTRILISKHYQLNMVIVSHDPRSDASRRTSGHWNFSDNTDLSEVLVVASKGDGSSKDNGDVTSVNLWRNPANSWEALGVARALTVGQTPSLLDNQGAQAVMVGDVKFGEAVTVPWSEIKGKSWMLACAFAQAELLRTAFHLARGEAYLPARGIVNNIPLTPLGQLGDLGPDPRDVYDGFRVTKERTPFPSFWGHDASLVRTMANEPNAYLTPLSQALEGRHLRKAEVLWPRAGRLLIAQRPRLNTKSLSAILLRTPVLCDVWWPVKLQQVSDDAETALVMWFNSTLGLISLWSNREDTQGAWVQFKKPMLTAMPVLDVAALSSKQKAVLSNEYERLCALPLRPFPEMSKDQVRADIDAAIAEALSLPDLTVLRELLSQEPFVCLNPLP